MTPDDLSGRLSLAGEYRRCVLWTPPANSLERDLVNRRVPFLFLRATSLDQERAVRTTGTVKWFNETKGFGFIKPDEGDKDCFVHHSEISEGSSLREGDKVEFEIVQEERGPAARGVAKV